jgi:acetyl-CoA synthetase
VISQCPPNPHSPSARPSSGSPTRRGSRPATCARSWIATAFAGYEALHARARGDIAWFWDAAIADLGIEFYTPYTQVLDLSEGVEFPRWCVGGKLNIIHNCLDKWQATPTRERVALRWEGEGGIVRTFTYAELHAEVNRCANALRSLGLGKGDAVGLYMPMIPELAIAFLAIIKIGGIILPLFSGYGHGALVARLADAGAKAIVTADGLFRRGAVAPMKPAVDAACEDVASVAHVIVVNRTGLTDTPWTPGRDRWWHDLIPQQPAEAPTEITDAEDVLMLIYTSGTTGKPKGAVHTHCGFPIKAAQDMRHSMDLKPADTIFWFTDMGWMMGPWLVFGALLNGATMLFYDGAPDFPDLDRVWALVERHRITHLGISPTLIRSLKPHGAEPVQRHDLASLRAVCSTGSPWDPESWLWTFHTVLGGEKPILNYSGGNRDQRRDFVRRLLPSAQAGRV